MKGQWCASYNFHYIQYRFFLWLGLILVQNVIIINIILSSLSTEKYIGEPGSLMTSKSICNYDKYFNKKNQLTTENSIHYILNLYLKALLIAICGLQYIWPASTVNFNHRTLIISIKSIDTISFINYLNKNFVTLLLRSSWSKLT